MLQAEESLRALQTSIPPHHASKIQLLLHQIQHLHEAESQRRATSDQQHWDQTGQTGSSTKELNNEELSSGGDGSSNKLHDSSVYGDL